MKFTANVYTIVRQIPRGRVATYGQIAVALARQTRLGGHLQAGFGARAVGNALHLNKSAEVPCHRVVDRNGRIAINFGFGGWKQHRRRLLAEGVKFKDERHVDLKLCQWQG